MATTTSITTTYAGEFAGKYIGAALLSGVTLDKGLVTIKPNVKYKEVIKKVTSDEIVKDASCDFNATSTLTLTERIIQPEEFQVNLQLCKKDFRNDWEAVQMGISVYDNLPPNFSDFLIAHAAEKVAQKIEQNIWNGTNATAGEFDGFTKLFLADAQVVDVVGTVVTAANVITEMGKVVDACPNVIYGKEDLVLYVSTKIAKAYVRALGGFGASGLGANGVGTQGTMWYGANQDLFFDGIKVAMVPGMPVDDMVLTTIDNLYFGTGLLSDTNLVKVLDMEDLDASQNCRVVMRFTAGIQYGFGDQVVYYT